MNKEKVNIMQIYQYHANITPVLYWYETRIEKK